MSSINIQLPAELAAQITTGDLSREVSLLVAINLFREERVSLGRAAELCAQPLSAFMDLCSQHGVPPLRYNLTELEEESRTLSRLGL